MKTLALMIVATMASAGSAFAQTEGSVRVTGVIELQPKEDLRTAAVTMTATDASGAPTGPLLAARMYPDGGFFFVNVEPGRYLLKASGQPFGDSTSMYAQQEVTVSTAPVGTLHIILNQPMPKPAVAPATTQSSGEAQAGFSATSVPPVPDGLD